MFVVVMRSDLRLGLGVLLLSDPLKLATRALWLSAPVGFGAEVVTGTNMSL